jgi:hypothetical protein
MPKISKIIIGLCLLFFTQTAHTKEFIDLTINTDPYPILTDKDGNITVQGKVDFAIYPEDTRMSELLDKLEDKSAEEKLKIPEFIVSQIFQAIQQKDLPAIYKCFTGEKDIARAKEHYKNVEYISNFFKDYTDITFRNRTYFGKKYSKIGYTCIGGPAGRTFPAWCFVKLVDGRYYVTRDIDYGSEVHIYGFLGGLHPWGRYPGDSFPHSDKEFMAELLFYDKDEDGREIKEHPISLSYNSAPYPPDHSLFVDKNRRKDEEAAFFYRAVDTFRKGSDKELLNIWHPDDREKISGLLETEANNIQTDIYQFRRYFEKIEDIYLVDRIYSSDGVIIYYEPIIEGKKGPLQTIIFKRSNEDYYLTAYIQGYRTYNPTQLLQSKYMLDSIKDRLEVRREKKALVTLVSKIVAVVLALIVLFFVIKGILRRKRITP